MQNLRVVGRSSKDKTSAKRISLAEFRSFFSGLENVIEASPEARAQVKEVTSHGGGGVDSSGKKWKIGELEFEALMRLLDNAVSLIGGVA